MGYTLKTLNDIRAQIAAHDDALAAARERRDAVLTTASSFPGTLRTYKSGSLAAGLMNHPVTDGDGGMVLDRRVYPELGPDGDGVGPIEKVHEVQAFLEPKLRLKYPNSTVEPMKRGLLIEVYEPLDEEQDPTVDLVIALNRKVDDALWIPCIDWKDEGVHWDPGHPEKHLQLIREGTRQLVRVRAHVIRLGKAWKVQFPQPGVCSFQVVALALESITRPMPLDEAMAVFYEHAARAIAMRDTQDPADVSGPIHLEDQPGREVVVQRFTAAASALRTAIANDDDEDAVREALQPVFPDYVKPPTSASSKAALADAIRTNRIFGLGGSSAALTHGAAVHTTVKSTRSFGGDASPW